MNAAETIQAAIDKLINERDFSTDGEWRVAETRDGSEQHIYAGGRSLFSNVSGYGTAEDADLIATLSRTIDFQLAILENYSSYGATAEADVVDLALAILGK